MKATPYKMNQINSQPLNGSMLVPVPKGTNKLVRVHTRLGNFALTVVIVHRDGTCEQNDRRKAAGKSYTKRAYRLSHILTGALVADFNTIGAAKKAAAFMERTADFLGTDWNRTEWTADDWRAIGKDFTDYRHENWQTMCYNTIENEFPQQIADWVPIT